MVKIGVFNREGVRWLGGGVGRTFCLHYLTEKKRPRVWKKQTEG